MKNCTVRICELEGEKEQMKNEAHSMMQKLMEQARLEAERLVELKMMEMSQKMQLSAPHPPPPPPPPSNAATIGPHDARTTMCSSSSPPPPPGGGSLVSYERGPADRREARQVGFPIGGGGGDGGGDPPPGLDTFMTDDHKKREKKSRKKGGGGPPDDDDDDGDDSDPGDGLES